MKVRSFGYLETEVPVIGQGSWQIPENGKDRDRAIEALVKGYDLGMVHIDTAEMYGRAEEVIGKALERINRENVFLVSKVLPSNGTYTRVIEALERTLLKLNTDYLDSYLLHWRGNIPLVETLAAFEKLEKDGKILSFGVSNFDVSDLTEAISCLSKGRLATNQVLYNLNERGIERNLIPFCQEHNISIVGYTPYGYIPPTNSSGYRALKKIASKNGCSVRQVILAFLTRLENTFTIPKASRLEHVEENAGAGTIELSKEDISVIDEHFPRPQNDTPLAML